MFKRHDGPKRVERKVTVHIPQDGDGFTKASLYMTFEIATNTINTERMSKFEAGDPDTDWMNEAVKGWRGYVESDGKTEIEFSAEELKLFLDVPYQRIAAMQEYFNAANGGLGRRKN